MINGKEYYKIIFICEVLIDLYPDIEIIPLILFTFINHKELDIVLRICEKFIKINPNHKVISDVLDKLIKLNCYSTAITLLVKSLNEYSVKKFKIAHKIIFDSLLHDIINFNEIIELIKAVLRVNPLDSSILRLLPWMIENNCYNYKIVRICQVILGADNSSNNYIHLILKILQRLIDNGKYEIALQVGQELLLILPHSPEIWLLIGFTFTNLKDFKHAFNAYKNAVKFSPEKLKHKVLSYIAWTYICSGDYNKGITLCLKIEKPHKSLEFTDIIYNYLGYAYHKQGNSKKGIKFLRKALQLNSKYCHAWINLAKIKLEINNYQAAYIACVACLKINNQFMEALNFYKGLLTNQNLVLLSRIIIPFQTLGYVTSVESVKRSQTTYNQRKLFQYQQDFINLLHMIARTPLDNSIISIYGDLLKCKTCNIPMSLKHDILNYAVKKEFIYYECKTCGRQEKEERPYSEESMPYIKLHIILKPSTKKPKFTKLIHENFFITYSNAGSISKNTQTRLNSAVILYRAANEGHHQIKRYWV